MNEKVGTKERETLVASLSNIAMTWDESVIRDNLKQLKD